MLGRHLRRWHCIQNPEERAMLLNLVNGRVEVKREHCPVPSCGHASTRLDRHLLGHKDVSRRKMQEYMAQLQLNVTIRLLGKLRATNPWVPLRSDLDLIAPQSTPFVRDLNVGTLKRACSKATASQKGQPKRVPVEDVCLWHLEGALEDPQSPSVDPPEKPCAEAFCCWQATALAKAVLELDQTRASLGKLRASRKYQALARKGELYVRTLKKAKWAGSRVTSLERPPKRVAVEAPEHSSRTTTRRRLRNHIPSPSWRR